ncbi:MAG: response regulator [Deltaproteobacteria bacterium]|nr:response regulator [Deltaproteobacteria bacterium]
MTLLFEHFILLVDDEQSITRSIQRLFRKEKYQILTAASGQEGLDVLAALDQPVSLIISDQRMPGMTGAQFLEKARALAPDAIRFLLTGYSDVKDILDAVNKGEIHRYLTKPWNDDDLLLQVRSALEAYELKAENQRLHKLTAQQNEALTELNQDLEKKIRERTLEILIKSQALEEANASLERGFVDTIRLLSSLVETLNPRLGSYLNFVAQLAKRMGEGFGLDKQEQEQIEIAGLLHDIGLMGLPKILLEKDKEDMVEAELKLFKQHPIIGQICLQPVERLDPVGTIIFSHHENYDGSGFPDGLMGEQIPLGARIIHVAADYTGFIRKWPKDILEIRQRAVKYLGHSAKNIVTNDPQILIREIIKQILFRQANHQYDPDVVNKLVQILEEDRETNKKPGEKSISISLWFLKPGMKLSQELRVSDGRLLLARGSVLNAEMISAIQKLSKTILIDERIEISVG